MLTAMKTGMKESIKGILLCTGDEIMGYIFTQPVRKTAGWKKWDAYSHYFIAERPIVLDREYQALQNIQAGANEVTIRDTRNAGQIFHSLKI